MTHVTQLGLWALWLGLEGISLKEAARSPSWVEYVADGVARLAGCDSDEGYMDRFVYADEVDRILIERGQMELGDVVVIAGDDYLNADGRAIDFTLAASSVTWPDLTSAVVTLRYRKMSGGAVLTKTMTVVTPTGASATVRLELTKAITETLSGKYKYDVEAVLANTRVVTLISGSLLVVDDI